MKKSMLTLLLGLSIFTAETKETVKAIIKKVPKVINAGKTSATVDALPVATIDELPTYDAIAWRSPVYFSNISANMKAFIDG